MAQIQITGLGGDARDISGETLDALAARLEGTLIYPDDVHTDDFVRDDRDC